MKSLLLAVISLIWLGFLLPVSQAQPALQQSDKQTLVLDAQAAHLKKVEVTVVAPVLKLLPDDTEGIPHQRFLIRLTNGSTVLIAHDTSMAPRIPLNSGDWVRIHGEYIWNPKGGVIHWTHHTDTPWHEGGWIEYQGRIYQ